MHFTLTHLLLTTSISLSSAQIIFNTSTEQFTCPTTPPNGAYCTGPSLRTNIIVRCTGTNGVAGNCNDNLAGVPPIGVKEFAPCYETTLTAGDAACSYDGTVYPDHGASFPVPGPGSSNASATISSSASLTTTAARNVSLSPSPETSISTSTDIILATIPSARYPIPVATNGTAAATGTGVPPSKTDGSGAAFTGAAGRMKGHVGAIFTNLVAGVAAFGLVMLLL